MARYLIDDCLLFSVYSCEMLRNREIGRSGTCGRVSMCSYIYLCLVEAKTLGLRWLSPFQNERREVIIVYCVFPRSAGNLYFT